jgi:RHS repeat-associated protein
MSHTSLSSFKRIVVIVLAMAASAVAQNIQNPQSAVDNLIRSNLHVDPSTGALQLQVPLGEFRGRGEASLPVVLYYSSKVWNIKHQDTLPCNGEPVSTYRAEYAKGSASGWTSSLGWFLPAQDLSLETYEGQTQKPAQQGNPTLSRIMRKYVTLPDGSRHELRRDDSPHASGADQAGRYYAVDGSRLWLDYTNDGSNILFMPNGSRIVTANGAIQYFDRNGNFLTYNSGVWRDTLDRPIGVPIPGAAPGVGNPTYALPDGMTYTMRWRNLADARTDPSQQLRYKGDTIGPFSCTVGGYQPNHLFISVPEPTGEHWLREDGLHNPVVLWQIGLPNGTNYTFTYNVYGELDKIVYPTGGSETFTYAVKSSLGGQLDDGTYSQGNRGVNSRVVSDGISAPSSWGYGGAPLGVTGVDPATAARSVTAPDGSVTVTWYYKSWETNIKYGFDDARAGMAREERVYKTLNGPMLRRRLMQLVMDGPLPGGYSTAKRNARVTKTVEIILDTGGDALAALTELTYDADLNVINTKRYGYVPIIQSTAQTGDFASMPSLNTTLLRTEETDYLTNNSSYRDRNLLALPIATRVKDGVGNIVAQSSISYDEPAYPLLTYGAVTGWSDPGTTARGNATTTGSWLNTTGTYLQTHAQYDQSGSVRNVWDAKGNLSQVEYASTYHFAYPTLTRTAVPDPTGQYGSNAPLVSTSLYDFNTGLVTSTTDANNQTTSYTYTDPLNRIKTVASPDGGLTTYNYSDIPGSLYVEMVTKQTATQSIYSYQFFDPLGRPNRSFLGVGGGNYITVDTEYDSMGRVRRVSNPYTSTGSGSAPNPSGYWTTSIYDELGRVLSITTPDSAVVSTKYSGNQVLVADQMSRKRMSQTDSLGRLTDVWEITPADLATEPVSFPGDSGVTAGYRTKYSYDALDNLRTVTQQKGTSGPIQTRTFVYDSLKRLTSAANPEICNQVGTQCTPIPVTYLYDNNGNLTRKTDARGIVIDYTYDALNRSTLVNYSDATADSYRQYDFAINGKGRVNQVWQSATITSATYIDSYDQVGRPKIQRQRFETGGVWSPSFQTQRDYNLAGGVISQTYPSGRTINYSYDDAGRVNSFTGNLGDGVTRAYSSGITYSAFGGKQQEQFGTQTPLFHKLHYNIRGQMYDVRLSTMSLQTNEWDWNRGALVLYYGYPWQQSGPLNNGNVGVIEHYVPINDQLTVYNFTQQRYAYDQLNRLTSVAEYPGTQGALGAVSFTQIFDYDRWGNRTINLATTNAPEPQFTASEVTNRLGVAAGYTGRMDYDAAGNLINDTYTSYGRPDGTPTRLYDAENRLTTAKDGNLVEVSSYSYNADGQRTRRKVNGVETWQVYGMDGELLAEYASGAATFVPTKEYGYRNGELLVTVSSGDDQRLKRFVYALYFGALQRDPTSQELTDKTNELITAGASSQAQLLVKAKEIARALFVQTTYETNPSRTDTQYVTDLYYAYLQRGPDAGGLGWWVPQAAGSVQNRINVLNAFEASGEFQTLVDTLYGTATSDGQRTDNYVTNFYQGALGRPPDANELSTNSATLNSAVGQSQVISAAETMGRNLFAAQVNDAGLSNTQYVTNLYEGFLQRGPDAGGLGFWSGQASLGQGRQNVLNAFAASSAFSELAGTLYREAYWLVADHLGTPRMVVNKSGSLASVKRHDYLPFGEELGLISGRTSAMGYSAIDNVRQKFTSYERDNETGLDFAQARYFASVQGRFTSPDNFLNDTRTTDPASWNLYVFTRNNPLRYTDPTGEKIYAGDLDDYQQAELLRRTNATYGCDHCTSVGADGYLAVDTTGLNQSVLNAAQSFTDAINSTTYFAQVQVSDNDPNVAFGENRLRRGGVTYNGRRINADLIVLDFGDDRHVGGNERAAAAFLNTVFAHEVAHGYLNIRDPQDRGRTGPTVDVINRITDALGLPRRAEYASDRRGEHWFSIRFQEQRIDRQRRPEVDRNGNPRMRDVYINWIRRNVGGRGVN